MLRMCTTLFDLESEEKKHARGHTSTTVHIEAINNQQKFTFDQYEDNGRL